jgi:protein involved in polysaccharide export with SLBB domain
MSLVLPSSDSPLQPGDILLVESSTDPGSINRRVTVLADGVVTLPAIGDISVSGNSLSVVEQSLTRAYQKFYDNPGIQVYRADASAPPK